MLEWREKMIRCYNCQKKVPASTVECRYCSKNPWLSGDTDDFAMRGGVLFRYNGEKREVTLPSGIEIIDESAFEDTEISSVTISDGVSVIRAYAFYSCRKLSYAYIPESTRKIERAAFPGCPNLRSVHLPRGCEVEDGAFDEGAILYRY